MNRHELAKVLLDEIVRTRAQLARLQMVLARRAEEGISRMSQCEECERLWKAYQAATIESVQLYEELRSITEDQGLEKLSGTTTRAEAAERLREEARQKLAEHQAATGASVKLCQAAASSPAPPQKVANSRVAIRFRPQERYTQ